MKYSYKNPWFKVGQDPDYHTDVEPITFEGYLIYHILPNQYDVVKNGVCISQRAGLNGAKLAAESVINISNPTYEDVYDRMMELYGHL